MHFSSSAFQGAVLTDFQGCDRAFGERADHACAMGQM
jgi:hypothetical protein